MEETDEIEDIIESDSDEFRYSITSYGADYTIDTIANRIESNKIYVPAFQRKYVWSQTQASKFIESLILGLPVPGVFLSKERETNRLLIIDGQQRMLSIANFYKGVFGEKKFRLKGVQPDLEGKSYEDLSEADQTRLDDSILHATIVKQDQPSEDESSIYMIFERLNTGGVLLQPQEIRACVYYGKFNDLLSKLNQNKAWRAIFGKENPRMKEQELILRFFALLYNYNVYRKGLKTFLNWFMASNRDLQLYTEEVLSSKFNNTINFVYERLGDRAFRNGSKVNAAIFDSVMIGIAKRLEEKQTISGDVKALYDHLLSDSDYKSFIESATSSETSVKGRINKAIGAFKDL